MNDRPPSGVSTPTDTAPDSSYAAYDASYEQSYGQGVQYGYTTDPGYPAGDPLFGPLPGAQGQPEQSVGDAGYGYDTGAMWSADAYQTNATVPGQGNYGWDADSSGQWDLTSYGTGSYTAVGNDAGGYDTGGYSYSTATETAGTPASADTADPAEAGDSADRGSWDTGSCETVSWNWESGSYTQPQHQAETAADAPDQTQTEPAQTEPAQTEPAQTEPEPEPLSEVGPLPAPRGRRRAAKPKRSALLSVAVPSACVMGVAGIAAASVSGVAEDSEDKPAQAADDATEVKPSTPTSKLDTQLAGLSADAGDFANRASRTQERIDLKERQEAERKRKEAEAARKEAMRPKFALPVAQQGLSAYYGQAGVNWLSVHTGIDFPVSYGTPVMAATDGTVTTKWDLSYGNMAIVTAPDGTETWYCHLSSTKIRSGQVKAGDTIGYSGNSGNSTGPHFHLEVRPGGGSAIDPLPWFRARGLDPT